MCSQDGWQDAYIDELVEVLTKVKDTLAEVPEAWTQLERAGINLCFTSPFAE